MPGTSLTTCLANGQRWISEGESAPSWLELEGGASAFGRLSLAERHRSDVPGKGKRPELVMLHGRKYQNTVLQGSLSTPILRKGRVGVRHQHPTTI